MQIIWRTLKLKGIIVCIVVTFVITCLISLTPFNMVSGKCKCHVESSWNKGNDYKKANEHTKLVKRSRHRMAILVPFRDRFDELLTFVPHMQKFLDKQNLEYAIFILNQVDKYRFNRASLINVGFLHVNKNFDSIAMHDIDLLPINNELLYLFPKEGPYHISSPEIHPRYHYSTFVGGILLIRREHFIKVNGMSNKYWGWGLEDDEFYVRLKEASLTITRPQNISTGTSNTFRHIHDRNRRRRDMVKCYNQREITRKRDRQTGLNNVSYKILDLINMTIADTPVTILNIALMCNKLSTPWCECNKLEISKELKMKEKNTNNNNNNNNEEN